MIWRMANVDGNALSNNSVVSHLCVDHNKTHAEYACVSLIAAYGSLRDQIHNVSNLKVKIVSLYWER